MTFRTYTRLLYSLIGVGFILCVGMLLLSVLSTQPRTEAKKILAVLFSATFAVFFIANAICGILHKKMLARGSPATVENEGKWFYLFHIPVNFVLGGMLLFFAVQTWRGVMHVNL